MNYDEIENREELHTYLFLTGSNLPLQLFRTLNPGICAIDQKFEGNL